MAFPNRELSQFGSFLLINDTGSTIGIATTATPTIGIGTTRSDVKLTVIGDTNISGIVRASEFYRGNDLLTNATIDRWSSGSGDNIYRLSGNIGIGTTIPTQQIDATQTIRAARFISTVTSGTAPFTVSSDTVVPLLNASFIGGKSAPTGSIVGTTDTQTLTNKTFQSSNINVIGAGITFSGSISGTATLKAQSNAVSNTLTLPSTTGTLVSTGDTGIVTSNMILDGTITNTDISPSAAIPYTKLTLTGTLVNNDLVNGTIQNAKLANSTISGVSLGSSLSNLIAGSYILYSGGSGAIFYNGSTNITASVNASSAVGSGSNIVARDANGDFTARNITISNATSSQTIQAADFNSTNSININSVKFVDASRNINAGIVTTNSLYINSVKFVDASRNINAGILTATTLSIGSLDINVGSASTVVINYGNSQLASATFSGSPTATFTNNSIGNNNTINFVGARNNIFGSYNDGAITGNENTVIGYGNRASISGTSNNIFGSGNSVGSGSYNNTIGHLINYNGGSSGNYNTLIGYGIFYQGNLSGSFNVVMGFRAAYTTTTIGVIGSHNVIFGTNAGYGLTSASNNVAIGQSALYGITTGNQNVALGSSTGIGITNGSQNVAIGYNQTVPILSGSNQLVIGAGNTSWIVGNNSYNVGIGTTNPIAKLDVNGGINGCITRQTAQSPTTGSTVTFSSIPSWAKKITIMFDSIGSSVTTDLTVGLGTGTTPTFAVTGYKGSVMGIKPGGTLAVNANKSVFSTAFIAYNDMTSGASMFGNMYLTNITGNTWTQTSIINDSTSTSANDSCYGSGSVSLTSNLTAIRIVCGSFAAGTINIMYEG